MQFEDWLKDKGSFAPIDLVDTRPALTHDRSAVETSGVYSKLHKEFIAEAEIAVQFLVNEFPPGEVRLKAIDQLLWREAADGVGDGEIGWFVMNQEEGADKFRCWLWDDIDYIAKMPKLSDQKIEIKKLIDQRIILHVLENPDDFIEPGVGLSPYLLKKFPWLIKTPFFGP